MKFKEFTESDLAKKPHFLLFGHPVGHSLSPVMHNIALKEHQIDAVYVAADLLPGELSSAFAWLNRPMFRGCNITIPYKNDFFTAVDRLMPGAEEIEAINTVIKSDDNAIIGANTDPYGFMKPLEEYADDLEGGTAILFGTGGASKAVVYALSEAGIEQIVLVSRSPQKVHARQNGAELTVTDYNGWQGYADEAGLIINSTPLGMASYAERSPVRDDEYNLFSGKICYDLVYNPAETPFLKGAAEAGATIINGLDMLIHQGNRSFKMWTGKEFPVNKIKDELIKRLGQ